MAWGAQRLRDLPWRRTRDPWAILVSEVMLQQTQVNRVLPRWQAFLARWPTPASCAEASLADVLTEWQGLGYPRRARNLHAAATAIRNAGSFPDELVGLLELPGVGAYTARALLAFAFERDVAVVDTNIARVIARLIGRSLTAREVQSAADALVAEGDGWTWNQVLMDLGAMVCRPAPACAECPVRRQCAWRLAGTPQPDPASGSAAVSRPQARFAGSDRQARGALLRALTGGQVVGLHELPSVMNVDPERASRLLADLRAEGLVGESAGGVTLPN